MEADTISDALRADLRDALRPAAPMEVDQPANRDAGKGPCTFSMDCVCCC